MKVIYYLFYFISKLFLGKNKLGILTNLKENQGKLRFFKLKILKSYKKFVTYKIK